MHLILKEHVIVIFLIAAVALDVALATKVSRLQAELRNAPAPNRLRPGELLPSFVATRLSDGARATITLADTEQPTILYVFSPTCGWSRKNAARANMLAASLKNFRFLGIAMSIEHLSEFLDQTRPNFPIYTDPDPLMVKHYRLGLTPSTLAVAANGRLIDSWRGAWVDDVAASLESRFSIRFDSQLGGL